MSTTTTSPPHARAQRLWDFWCEIETDDPVRRTQNRTLAQVMAVFIFVGVLHLTFGLVSDKPGILTTLIALPTLLGIWWINRRGTITGPICISILLLISVPTTFDPKTFFVDNYAVIHVGFLLPTVVTIFFVRPAAGIITIIATIAALSLSLVNAGYTDGLSTFVLYALINLSTIGAIMIYVASILIRHIRELDSLNNKLELRVADRTAQLEKANAFIERRATERAEQVAAVVHDLRNTGSSVDSILSILNLDVDDTMAKIRDTVVEIEHSMAAIHSQVSALPVYRPENGNTPEDIVDQSKVLRSFSSLTSKVREIDQYSVELTEFTNAAGRDVRAALGGQRGLLSDMLDMAQLEADTITLRPGATDLYALATNVVLRIEHQAVLKHCAITVTTEGDTSVWCDTRRIERVLDNVIGNALKYTSAYRTSGGGVVHVVVSQGDNGAICRVIDNGPGIAAEDLNTLGQRWHRAERSTAGAAGTGLGLHFCKSVLAASNGDLSIISDGPGHGTTVTILLPAHEIAPHLESTTF